MAAAKTMRKKDKDVFSGVNHQSAVKCMCREEVRGYALTRNYGVEPCKAENRLPIQNVASLPLRWRRPCHIASMAIHPVTYPHWMTMITQTKEKWKKPDSRRNPEWWIHERELTLYSFSSSGVVTGWNTLAHKAWPSQNGDPRKMNGVKKGRSTDSKSMESSTWRL